MDQVIVFQGERMIARGDRAEVTRAVESRCSPSDQSAMRVFEDGTGRVTDLNLWDAPAPPPSARSRGRPKLGVTAREVTLLPTQWEWLSGQPGGSSATLRRLVEEARRKPPSEREARDAVYRFASSMCGDRGGYEEALRALYRGDMTRFRELTGDWPADIRRHMDELLGGAGA